MGYIQLKLPKRIKNKIENSRRNREAKANHEEWLQDQGLDNYTLKQKTKQTADGKITLKDYKIIVDTIKYKRR